MTRRVEPHEPDVIYVPICSTCGRAVELTEADDGTWRHDPEHAARSPEGPDEGLREARERLIAEAKANPRQPSPADIAAFTAGVDAVLPLLIAERERADHWERSASEWRKDCHTAWRERNEARERVDHALEGRLAKAERERYEARDRADRLARDVAALCDRYEPSAGKAVPVYALRAALSRTATKA